MSLIALPGVICADVTPEFTSSDTPQPRHVIPFQVLDNRVLLSIKIGKSPLLKIILDSGMGYDGVLIYNPDVRNAIQLVDPKNADVAGAGKGNASSTMFSEAMDFSIGDLVWHNQKIIVLQQDHFKGFPTDGVVGYSLLGHYAVEIDYDTELMTLHNPDMFIPDSSWESVPLVLKEHSIPWVTIHVSIETEELRPFACYIDSASRESLELLIRPDLSYSIPEDVSPVHLGRGLSGEIHGYKGRVKSADVTHPESSPHDPDQYRTPQDDDRVSCLLSEQNRVF